MKTLTIAKHVVQIYEDLDEMPMANYHKFNKFLLFETGLAPDTDGLLSHITKLSQLISADNKDKAIEELSNMQQSIYYIMEGVSPISLAFASLIYSIDNKVITDYSDNALKQISNKLNAENFGRLKSIVKELKKKLTLN